MLHCFLSVLSRASDVPEELGAAIAIDEQPNVRYAPLLCLTLQDQPAFDVLWLLRRVEYGEALRRDMDFKGSESLFA